MHIVTEDPRKSAASASHQKAPLAWGFVIFVSTLSMLRRTRPSSDVQAWRAYHLLQGRSDPGQPLLLLALA
jgi:hypothetical protein